MKFRGLAISAVVLLLLGGALYWSEHRKPTATAVEGAAPVILKLDQTAVSRVEIAPKDGQTVVLVKDPKGQWSIAEPEQLAADQDAVTSLLATLSPLNAERLVASQSFDPKQYGLDPAAVEIDVTGRDGRSQKLLLGDSTPTGDSVYAMLAGDPRLFTTAQFDKTSLNKGVNDLRDKRLLPVSADKVGRLELVTKNRTVGFNHGEDGWQIVKPRPLRSDDSAIGELVRTLTTASMDLTAKETDASAAFAHAEPFATAKLTGDTGTQVLEVRKNKEDYYAKSSAVAGIYKVNSDLAQALSKNLDDYRNKKLFDFAYTEPDKVELHLGGKSWVLTRTGADWFSSGRKMDAEGVDSLVSELRDLTAEKFVDSGFGKPEIEVSVTSNNGKRLEKVLMAKSGADYIAQRENEPSLYQLSASTVQDLQRSADGIKPAMASAK